MALQVKLSEKHSPTSFALKSFDALMDFKVLVKVCPLGEGEFAIRLGALEWSFTSVNT